MLLGETEPLLGLRVIPMHLDDIARIAERQGSKPYAEVAVESDGSAIPVAGVRVEPGRIILMPADREYLAILNRAQPPQENGPQS